MLQRACYTNATVLVLGLGLAGWAWHAEPRRVAIELIVKLCDLHVVACWEHVPIMTVALALEPEMTAVPVLPVTVC